MSSDRRRIGLGEFAGFPMTGSLEWLERARLIHLDHGVELFCQACFEIMVHSLRFGQVDNARRSWKIMASPPRDWITVGMAGLPSDSLPSPGVESPENASPDSAGLLTVSVSNLRFKTATTPLSWGKEKFPGQMGFPLNGKPRCHVQQAEGPPQKSPQSATN